MNMNAKYHNASPGRIEKIIGFFKSLKIKKPVCDDMPEDGGRDKTEAEYQEEQSRWLSEVEQKRRKSKQVSLKKE
jgi:hypothetical protein